MTTDPQTAIDQLDHLHRITLPDLRRQIEYHQDGKARWRKRAKAAEARVAELELAAVPVAAPPVAVDSSEDRCAECGHFRGAHEEAEEPVSVGRCTVCADEDEWHGFEAVEESPVAAPPTTEQGDLRELVAAALYRHEWPGKQVWQQALAMDRETFLAQADAVLAVLPAPADRAATLREAADAVAALDRRKIGIEADTIKDAWEEGRDEGADLLRAMAVEAGQASEDQPETPLEKRLRYSERRNDELRTECKRRGKTVLEQAEKIVALEREIDEVRRQLGAEILRAGQAEAELRRLAVAAEAGGPSRGATEPQGDAQGGCPTPLTHNWGCGCRTDEHPAALGTLPAWLYQRFTPSGVAWDNLDGDEQSYWEHQARAVRRAVTRGGFKEQTPAPAAAAAPAVSSRPGTEQEA